MRIADLWQLQETDSALDSRRSELAEVEERLAAPDALIADREHLEELKKQLRAARSAQKDIDLEAEDLRARIAPAEQRLYGGSIRNPKELSDLQADIDQLKRHLESVEERELEALATLESLDEECRSAEEALTTAEETAHEEQQELTTRRDVLSGEIDRLGAERQERSSGIDAGLLLTYDRIRAAHQGRGVARLERSLCSGCRITLPTNMANRARSGNTLVQCPNCERILIG